MSQNENNENNESIEEQFGLTAADIQELPEQWGSILRLMLRNQNASDAELAKDAIEQKIVSDESEFHNIMKEMLEKHFIRVTDVDPDTLYRVRLLRKRRNTTMQGIWNVLEAGDEFFGDGQGQLNPELRKARSDLADSLLADMSQDVSNYSSKTDADASGLMSALTSAGHNAMKQYDKSKPSDDSPAITSAEPPKPRTPSNTSENSPTDTEEKSGGFWQWLMSLFGNRKP